MLLEKDEAKVGKGIMVIAVFPTAQTDKIAVTCVTVWAQHKNYFPLPQNYVPLQKIFFKI